MKKILIAGGAGFIGTRLSNKISSKYDVTVMDHFWFGDMLNDNITKIKQDINSIKTEARDRPIILANNQKVICAAETDILDILALR